MSDYTNIMVRGWRHFFTLKPQCHRFFLKSAKIFLEGRHYSFLFLTDITETEDLGDDNV